MMTPNEEGGGEGARLEQLRYWSNSEQRQDEINVIY